jgi:TolB protein
MQIPALINSVFLFLLVAGCNQTSGSSEINSRQKTDNKQAENHSIIFTKQKNRTDNIYLISTDGKTRQITDHKSKDSSPMLSPDGKRIVFTSERVGWWKIWLMDIGSEKFTQLTDSSSAEYSPSWSPDGKKIVFVSERDGNAEIYVMNPDSSGLVNITTNEESDTMPFWGKDNKIYFSSKVKGVYEIMRMNPNGTEKEIISKEKGNKFMPQISPDQKHILFYGDKDGNPEIYLMSLEKNNETKRLTNNPLMDIRPRWSPDGKKIVFERGNKSDNHHIYIMNADGKGEKQLTFEDYNYAPSFITRDSVLSSGR